MLNVVMISMLMPLSRGSLWFTRRIPHCRTCRVPQQYTANFFLDYSGAGYVGFGIVPKHYLLKVGADGFAKKPLGGGPFKVEVDGYGWLCDMARRGRVITIWMVTLLIFLLLRVTGNPIETLVPPDTLPEDRQRLMSFYGLDRPVWQQYLNFVKGVFVGNFGVSLRWADQSAFDVVMQ